MRALKIVAVLGLHALVAATGQLWLLGVVSLLTVVCLVCICWAWLIDLEAGTHGAPLPLPPPDVPRARATYIAGDHVRAGAFVKVRDDGTVVELDWIGKGR